MDARLNRLDRVAARIVTDGNRGDRLRFARLGGVERGAQRREVRPGQREARLALVERLDVGERGRARLGRALFGGFGQGLLALLGLSERNLRLAEVQERDRVARIFLEDFGELARGDRIARRVLIVDRLHQLLLGRALRGVELRITDEVLHAIREAGVIFEILVDHARALVVHRAQMLHE